MNTSPRVLLLTKKEDQGLLGSYGRALQHLGLDVRYWDLEIALQRSVRLGRFGRLLNNVVGIDPWITRANRELVIATSELRPDLVIVAGAARVTAGALAQLRAALPCTRLVLLWPDTLLNLVSRVVTALPMYDLVASYSSSAIPPLQLLGANRAEWLPFAVDPVLFPQDVAITDADRRRLACDVSFVGNHRPEREQAVLALVDAGLNVKVWGYSSWQRDSSSPNRVREYWQGTGVSGEEFVRAVQCSRINLNLIDPTNFPAANMRFFEIMGCGGAQLVSECGEMAPAFPDRTSVVYFDSMSSLVQKAKDLLADESLRRSIQAKGHEQAMAGHTYVDRARSLLHSVGLELPDGGGTAAGGGKGSASSA